MERNTSHNYPKKYLEKKSYDLIKKHKAVTMLCHYRNENKCRR
jgi:hypothetical protein